MAQVMDDGQTVRGLRPRWSRRLQYSSDKGRCDRVPSVGRICSSWSWARHGTAPEAAAFAAPTAVMADSAAYPLPEQQRYECDCEILVGASRAPPRRP